MRYQDFLFALKRTKCGGEPPHKKQSSIKKNKPARNQTLFSARITIEILPLSHRP